MRFTFRKVVAVSILVAGVMGVAALNSVPASAADDAAATYKAKCAACHGMDGKGKEAMKTQDFASADVQKMTDSELSTVILNGKGKMPAYKSMPPEQVKSLVAYIRSFKK